MATARAAATATTTSSFSAAAAARPLRRTGMSPASSPVPTAPPSPSMGPRKSLTRRALRPVQAVLGLKLPFMEGVSAEEREARKEKLLVRIAPLARGAAASDDDKADVARLFADLEKANPTKAPLASPSLNGKWRLLYTTSASILGTGRPAFLRPSGPIYQVLDGPSLSAENRETFPFFNRVVAALETETASRVAVQFKRFFIFGLIPVDAPATARGKLDVTYLDDTLRLSRGDKGNIFVLEMVDPSDRPAAL